MLDENSRAAIAATSRTTLIIVLALCAGVLAFGVYATFLSQPLQNQATGLMTYLSLGFAGMQVALAVVVPRVIVGHSRRQIAAGTFKYPASGSPKMDTDAVKLAAVYVQTTIIGCALLEGGAFFALFAYMIEGNIAALAAAGLLLLGIALHLPISDRILAWVEQQLQRIDEERQLIT